MSDTTAHTESPKIDADVQRPRVRAFEDVAVETKITRAYGAALASFEAGHWDATITACGKALESIAKNELPYNERGGTLGQLLEKLPKHVKLEQPMTDLAAAVKDPKSLGAHFDLEREANVDIARATLELVEAFITYVYLFRDKVARLKSLLEDETKREGREETRKVLERSYGDDKAAPKTPARASGFDNFEADPYDIKANTWNIGRDDKR